MKANGSVRWLLVLSLLAVLVGCSKTEEVSAPAGNAPAPQAEQTQSGKSLDKVVQEQTPAATATPQKAAEQVTQTADKVTGLIDSAKSLISENKFDAALKILSDLSSQSLTPDQQSMVDSLKKQVQQAMATKATGEATKAASDGLNNLLKKK